MDNVGSGAGQGQLCGSQTTPLPVDFSRSSKPASSCATLAQTGYAKDGVPIIDYPVNPSVYGTSTNAAYSSINGGVIGPVASGWLPGDAPGGPYSGTALDQHLQRGQRGRRQQHRLPPVVRIELHPDHRLGPADQPRPGAAGARRLDHVWFAHHHAELGSFPSTVGSGDAVSGTGIPSGTTVSSVSGSSATLSANATATGTATLDDHHGEQPGRRSGPGGRCADPPRRRQHGLWDRVHLRQLRGQRCWVVGGCTANMNPNAANDPNSATAPSPNSAHIALENNSDQLDQFAAQDFPSPDYVDQAIEVATSLYIESNGVFNTNPYAAAADHQRHVVLGEQGAGERLRHVDGVALEQLLPDGSDPVQHLPDRHGAGVDRWILELALRQQRQLHQGVGQHHREELRHRSRNGHLTTFGFPRLTDATAAPANGTPADGIAAPNNSCAASLPVTTTSGSKHDHADGRGQLPARHRERRRPGQRGNVGVTDANLPAGTTVVSGAGTSTLTLSNAATASGTSVATAFSGVPAVTSVASPQT